MVIKHVVAKGSVQTVVVQRQHALARMTPVLHIVAQNV